MLIGVSSDAFRIICSDTHFDSLYPVPIAVSGSARYSSRAGCIPLCPVKCYQEDIIMKTGDYQLTHKNPYRTDEEKTCWRCSMHCQRKVDEVSYTSDIGFEGSNGEVKVDLPGYKDFVKDGLSIYSGTYHYG